MGRQAKSVAEKVKTGAGRRPTARAAALSGAARPSRARPPSWLTDATARATWKRVVPELQRLNVYNESLRDVVGRYCQHFGDWVRLTREIKRDGSTIWVTMTDGENKMLRVNPAIRVRDLAERALVDLEDRFGFSPLARYRLTGFQAAQPRTDLFGHAAAKPAAIGDKRPAALPPAAEGSAIGALRTLQ